MRRRELAWLMIALSLIAVVYIGLVALVQTDMKQLIAYSSISHMGFVTLGFFIFNAYGVEGGAGADDLARLRLGARCSSASACSTTACTRASSPTTAGW